MPKRKKYGALVSATHGAKNGVFCFKFCLTAEKVLKKNAQIYNLC
jgi:hypothetical protein